MGRIREMGRSVHRFREKFRDFRGRYRTISVLVFVVGVAAVVGCIAEVSPRPVPPAPEPKPTPAPFPISLPKDEMAHEDRLEWWYYSGHLRSDEKEFGYHFVLFRQQIPASPQPAYFAQFSIVHPESGAHIQGSAFDARAEDLGKGLFQVEFSNWELLIDQNSHTMKAVNSNGDSIDLTARPSAPAMIHHEDGWFAYTGWSYYYSWPGMETFGEMTFDGKTFSVEGQTWFDHQWGNFYLVGSPAGWQWFAMTLDNGSFLKVTAARDTSGETALLYATYQTPEGETQHIPGENGGIQVAARRTWTSPSTGARYPVAWDISIPALNADIKIDALTEDQEVTDGLPTSSIYWEGQTSVSGILEGVPVAGRAYAELSGYSMPLPLEWRKSQP